MKVVICVLLLLYLNLAVADEFLAVETRLLGCSSTARNTRFIYWEEKWKGYPIDGSTNNDVDVVHYVKGNTANTVTRVFEEDGRTETIQLNQCLNGITWLLKTVNVTESYAVNNLGQLAGIEYCKKPPLIKCVNYCSYSDIQRVFIQNTNNVCLTSCDLGDCYSWITSGAGNSVTICGRLGSAGCITSAGNCQTYSLIEFECRTTQASMIPYAKGAAVTLGPVAKNDGISSFANTIVYSTSMLITFLFIVFLLI